MSQNLPPSLTTRKHTAVRHKFSASEDIRLRSVVDTIGTKSWEDVARMIPGRTGRQCRDRYKNYLLDSFVSAAWTPEEDARLCRNTPKSGQSGPKSHCS
jgi:hypothetical protein